VQPDAGAFTGGGVFTGFFVGIRSANTLIGAVKNASDASGVSAPERSALLGLARTMKALNYWNVMETRDSAGMPIDLDRAINAEAAPWVCKPNVLAYVSALLDSAAVDLAAGGGAFSVTLPGGYRAVAGTPAGFLKFNRGIKAKVELYRGLSRQAGTGATGFNNAIAALGASFMQTTDLSADGLALGVAETYSTASGDVASPLVDAALHLNPAVSDSMQAGDHRGAKIVRAADPYSVSLGGTTVSTPFDYAFSLGSTSLTHPLPILKNEELLLLRAQAAIELNDLATARTFLNFVRVNSGGLAPYGVFASLPDARNALLYEKRYSLLMEGPQRLLDLRAYSRLNSTSFHAGTASSPIPGDVFTSALPIPKPELDARGGSVTLTCN
jgi:starch-binding outer membrane protein, SusD/RagB family